MNAYEQKQEAKRERLEARAERLRQKAAVQFRKGDLREEFSGIPFGQPILVGHHSEGRHRRAIERADNAMRRGVEASKQAATLEHRAASIGSGGISSDDPEAVDKLREKLAELEAAQARMRLLNKAHAAFTGKPEAPGTAAVMASLSEDEQRIVKSYVPGYSWEPHPYAPYQLSNNNANIKRVRDRIAELERNANRQDSELLHNSGVRMVENTEANRVQLFFPDKPDAEIRTRLKRSGFRWSPSEGAWQRQLNGSGIYAAKYILDSLLQPSE